MTKITADHYIAGLVGAALLRTWYVDAESNEVRLAELRKVIERADEFPYSLVLDPHEVAVSDAYAEWAETYDETNPLVELDNQVNQPLLKELSGPDVLALDAACGTARHGAFLAEHGCGVVALDLSAEMLAIARTKIPGARIEQGTVERLPFDDGAFDLAVISLALCHLADPRPAIAELARVLRPGGTLLISDPHPAGAMLGGQAFYGGISPDRPMTWVRNHCHNASVWLDAFRRADLTVEECAEVPFSDEQIAASPAASIVADATRAAMTDVPSLWVWTLRR